MLICLEYTVMLQFKQSFCFFVAFIDSREGKMSGSDEVAQDREMSQARFELTSATLASEPDAWVQNVLIARPQLQPGVC